MLGSDWSAETDPAKARWRTAVMTSSRKSPPTWHGVDQVTTQNHEPGPGLQPVDALHRLLGQLHLFVPFVAPAFGVAHPPGLHQPQLGVRRLDEAERSGPLLLCIWEKDQQTGSEAALGDVASNLYWAVI